MKKKNVFGNMFDFKLTKTDKKILKGTALAIGTVALLGASSKIAKRFGK